MRVRDGPAAVRGDASSATTPLACGPGRRWRGEPRVRRPAASATDRTPRGRRIRVPSPVWSRHRLRAARRSRRNRRQRLHHGGASRTVVPGDGHGDKWQGHRDAGAPAHRVALCHRNRVALRDRRGLPGRSPSTTSRTTRRAPRRRRSPASRRTSRRSSPTAPISSSCRTTRRGSSTRSAGSGSRSSTTTAPRRCPAPTSRSASSASSRASVRALRRSSPG